MLYVILIRAPAIDKKQSKNPAPFDFVFGGPLTFDLEEWEEKR